MSKSTSRGRTIGCGLIVSLMVGVIGLLSDVLDLSERFFPQPTPTATENPVLSLEPRDFLGLTFGRRWTYSLEERTEDYAGETPEANFDLNTQVFTEEVVFFVPLTGGLSIAGIEVTGQGLIIGCQANPEDADYWLVIEDSAIYRTCTHDEANSLADALLAGETPDRLVPEYILPLLNGQMWPGFTDLAERDDGMYQWIVEGSDDISVPAGEFTGCLRLILRTLPDATIKWICPGVGLTAMEYHHHGQLHYLRLELLAVEGK